MAYRIEVMCVTCDYTNADPAAVDEAMEYQRSIGEHELILHGETFQIYDVCPHCCDDVRNFYRGDPFPS